MQLDKEWHGCWLQKVWAVLLLSVVTLVASGFAAKQGEAQRNASWNFDNPPNSGKEYWCLDKYGLFRKTPGDAGWIPGIINAQVAVGKLPQAEELLRNAKLPFEVQTTQLQEAPYRFVKYYEITTGGFREELWIKRLLASGYFKWAARVGEEAGPGDAILTVKQRKIFSGEPNEQEGATFVRNILVKQFGGGQPPCDVVLQL